MAVRYHNRLSAHTCNVLLMCGAYTHPFYPSPASSLSRCVTAKLIPASSSTPTTASEVLTLSFAYENNADKFSTNVITKCLPGLTLCIRVVPSLCQGTRHTAAVACNIIIRSMLPLHTGQFAPPPAVKVMNPLFVLQPRLMFSG